MKSSKGKPGKTKLFAAILAVAVIAAVIIGVLSQKRENNTYRTRMDDAQAEASNIFREDGIVNFLSADGALRVGITVEIAADAAEQTRGLMGRTRMSETQGMLFIFDTEEPRSFWMSNTPLPLDIVYADSRGEIVKIHRNAAPFSLESLESGRPARYVVEVNAGFCERYSIGEGDRIAFLKR